MRLRRLISLATASFFLWFGCTHKNGANQKELWIYTSIYKEVIAEMEPLLRAKFPNIKFQWFQSGSENVAARLNAELSAGHALADLLMSSDPLWYLELKKAGHLLSYHSPGEARLPSGFREPDGAFAIERIPVTVIGYNTEAIPKADAPKSFADLTDPKWKGKISMGNPMESGTAFNSAIQLVKKRGWEYFQALRKNDLLAAGGSSAIVSRIETKERPVGILLLENILEAQKRGSPIAVVYPSDGAVLIPSPVAILAHTKEPELAKQVYDYFLGDEMQKVIVHQGRMYSPTLPGEAPAGAEPFSYVLAHSLNWNLGLLEELYKERESTKKKFMETVLY